MAITITKTRYNQEKGTREVVGAPEITYVGCVLSTYTHETRIMSDVWDLGYHALVWDAAKGCVSNVLLGFAEHSADHWQVEVDATPEVKALAEAAAKAAALAIEKDEAERKKKVEAERKKKVEAERKAEHDRPTHGKTMKVVKGRKVPLGTVGRVFWIGQDNYGTTKVGLATSDRKDASGRNADVVWTAASNCVNVEEYRV